MNTQVIFVSVAGELFRFDSFEEWINQASAQFAKHQLTGRDTLCVDALGRICLMGLHFRIARDEKTYPIKVYLSREETIDRAPSETAVPA